MNIYQGLLLLNGFRVLPEDVTEGGQTVVAAAPATDTAMVPDQYSAGTTLPAAGACA